MKNSKFCFDALLNILIIKNAIWPKIRKLTIFGLIPVTKRAS